MNRIRVGIAGMGNAGLAFVAPLRKHHGFEWVACAEPDAAARARAQQAHGVAAYASFAELLAHDGLDAVCIATPTAGHAAQAIQAAEARKHVLVEKPMAVTLEDARAMVAAAARAGVVLQVGHSHSYDAPVQAMRRLIDEGGLGRVRMVHTWCFTDWMHRPRRPDEFDIAQGGGVTFRQGSHQFDVLRLLCGGRARSVRGRTFDWDAERRSIGAHSVSIDFDDGAVGTAVYNGYGGFMSAELCHGISEWGFPQPDAAPRRRAGGQADELQAKQARAGTAIPAAAPYQPHFGLTVVSCERGDIRQAPQGLLVYGERGRELVELPTDRSPRDAVVDEFHQAVRGHAPTLHDGRWGLANLEVCLAAMRSSELGADVALREQVPLNVHDRNPLR